jgi:LysR family nitrogen assimilation transcriptional regulator
MDIKQLRALLAITDTGSVTRAAKLLHIVQPAVSRQLRLLEEDVGTTLFERGRYGIELTEAGQTLVEYARRALHDLDRARAEITPVPGAIAGIVNIGLLPSTSDLLASSLLAAVSPSHPAIKLRIWIGYTGHLRNWLEAGEVDAALLYDPKPSLTMQVEPLLEEKVLVVGLPTAELCADHPVAVQDLEGKPLILPSVPHGLRMLVEHACTLAGVHLSLVAETNSMRVQRKLVLGGHGFTILPSASVFDDVALGLLSAAPLTTPELQRKIVLALPNTRRTTAAVRCVAAALVEVMRDAVRRGNWSAARWLAD